MRTDLISTDSAESIEYLFRNQSHIAEFVIVEEEMAQLNDYCALCMCNTDEKLTKLDRQANKLLIGPRWLRTTYDKGEEIDIDSEDIVTGIELASESWRATKCLLVPASSLLLLSCFTEKSLRWLCLRLGSGNKVNSKKSVSKIDAYLHFLRADCKIAFDEPGEVAETRERCRLLRNAFAHGEWEECAALLQETNLVESFHSISELFTAIEDGYKRR